MHILQALSASTLLLLGAAAAEPALSPAQSAVVAKAIATLKSPEERQMAGGWTHAKQAAEMICRPLALPALKKQSPAADRVFLGTDDPATLSLESAASLKGSGTVRVGSGWRDFTFTCAMNPKTGKATSFTASLKPAA